MSETNLTGGSWQTNVTTIATEGSVGLNVATDTEALGFFRLKVEDVDSDGDGLTDFEECALGFNPATRNTDRFQQNDFLRVTNGLTAANTVTISAINPLMNEGWPAPGWVAVRRKGGLGPLSVNVSFGGTAALNTDFVSSGSSPVQFGAGVREAWLELTPLADGLNESTETITVTVLPGTGYVVGASNVAELTLENHNAGSGPSAHEAARFLIQAAFGPDQDSAADPDYISENVEEVMAMGFNNWMQDQFDRPMGWLEPMAQWTLDNSDDLQLYTSPKQVAWWGRAMGSPKLTPSSPSEQLPDPLRQRVAFALSEILVISDRPETLAVAPVGLANYYDVLVRHAFGNYSNLLYDVAMHPCMGLYLSHLGNQKADPLRRIYPDENFAREIMQLFSIGLWQLNPDGTKKLDVQGQPIPTYNNNDITEVARVFTGLSMGGPDNIAFGSYPRAFTHPMKIWDSFHDCDTKSLLGGLNIPARTPSVGSLGTAGIADVRAAVGYLFNHTNTGPFIGKQLIQRLVTSNPSTGYVARVAAAFANNGAGVRGDMKAVVQAILLDVEARSPQRWNDPTWGKLREPFLRVVNFARAFNATSASGIYALDAFELDHAQMPLNAPSVFNFFLPTHSPPGLLTEMGLVAPEFQIVNAGTAISAANYFGNAVWGGLHRWGVSNPENNVTLNLTQELPMVVPAAQVNQDVPSAAPYDPDALLRRLDFALTGGTLSPRQFQVVRETLERIPRPSWHWHREYLRAAIYLIVTSPEFCVVR